jgi:hypothetical protein
MYEIVTFMQWENISTGVRLSPTSHEEKGIGERLNAEEVCISD